LNLRRAQVNDAPKLAQVHVDAWQAAYQGIVPDAFLKAFTYQKREQAFRHALETKSEETYLLEENDSAVAILTIGPSLDEDLDAIRTGEIWGIYIAPRYWRRGLGRNLVQEAECLLKALVFMIQSYGFSKGIQQQELFMKRCGFIRMAHRGS
jgi:GNAT superfamily N-acetyltransferase